MILFVTDNAYPKELQWLSFFYNSGTNKILYVEYQRTNNVIAKHVKDTNHEVNWKEAECLEGEIERTQGR